MRHLFSDARAGNCVVGQSVNCNLRIGNHLNDEQKVFDSHFVVECPESRLDELEAKYIVKFRPKYNLTIPKVASEIGKLFAALERAAGFEQSDERCRS